MVGLFFTSDNYTQVDGSRSMRYTLLMSSFAIPGAYPPPADKAISRVTAGADGALRTEVLSIPKSDLPRLIRVMVVSQENVVWMSAGSADGPLQAEDVGEDKKFYLHVKPGTLPPGGYRVFLWVRDPGDPSTDLTFRQSSSLFIIPDTPFTAIDYSSYRPLGNLSGYIDSSLEYKCILDEVVASSNCNDYWSYWET